MHTGRLLVLVMIIGCANSFSLQAEKSLKDSLPASEWHIPELPYFYIRFGAETYVFGAYEGEGDFAHGMYKILDKKSISISRPVFDKNGLEEAITWVDKLWKSNEVVLQYNADYANIYTTGSLENRQGNIVLTSTKSTTEGSIVNHQGIKAIKKEQKFFVTENLVMRKKPSRQSEADTYEVDDILYQYGHGVADANINGHDCKIIKKEEVRILPKGYEILTIAHTVAIDEIAGRRAPWYFYNFLGALGNIIYHGWIFGGYLSPYEEEKSSEYQEILEKNLLEMKWIELNN